MGLKGFPFHLYTDINRLRHIKDLFLVGPWEMFQWCAVASVGVPLHSSEGDEHQRVILNQEEKTRYVVYM